MVDVLVVVIFGIRDPDLSIHYTTFRGSGDD